MSGGAGYRYTEDRTGATVEYTDGFDFELLFNRVWKKGSLGLLATRDQYSTIDERSVERYRATLRGAYRLSHRFSTNAAATFGRNREADRDDSDYYNITATDTWGLKTTASDSGIPWSYTVADTNPPLISNVLQNPSPATVNYLDTVDVTADITDDGFISNARLYLQIDGGGFQAYDMDLLSGDTYNYTIPAQPYNTFVQYYINASDTADNWAVDDNSTNYYSYTVIDNIDPLIENLDRTPISVGYDDSPLIECDVTDPPCSASYQCRCRRLEESRIPSLFLEIAV